MVSDSVVGRTRPGRKPNATEGKDEVLNVRADAVRHRTALQHVLAAVSKVLAHPLFFFGEVALHVGWIVLNAGVLPGTTAWDPYPFSFLTGMASVQALFIGLLILMYARHEAMIAEVREEMDLQVALHSERETSKVLRMLTDVHHSLGVASAEHDRELEVMSQPLDPVHLKRTTEEHIQETQDNDGA